ncbi:MAG: DoxX family membrane protein [Alphaproteobacteria bacterium]|nr:DoxX family membrane protein [Alphaproteobacteria bacterium]
MDAIGHELWLVLSVAGRVCVGLVFVLAGVQKAQHWKILPGVIANYRLLPRFAVAPVSALLPVLEMIVGLLLLSGFASPAAPLAAIALLALFAAAMAINLRRGRAHIDCGCGQSFLKQSLRWSLVARNAVLALLLVPSLASAAMPLALSGVVAGLAFFLLTLVLNTLSALPPALARGHRFA